MREDECHALVPQSPQEPGLSRTETGSWAFSWSLPRGWQGPNHLNHYCRVSGLKSPHSVFVWEAEKDRDWFSLSWLTSKFNLDLLRPSSWAITWRLPGCVTGGIGGRLGIQTQITLIWQAGIPKVLSLLRQIFTCRYLYRPENIWRINMTIYVGAWRGQKATTVLRIIIS